MRPLRDVLTHGDAGRIAVAGTVVLAAALGTAGWLDYRATRAHLLAGLRDRAVTLRYTISAAARANRAAAQRAETELSARLLDNARLLARLDAVGGLSAAALDEIASHNSLFRVSVYDGSGTRVLYGSTRPGDGQGFGMARLVDRVGAAGAGEAVTEMHRSRWGEARLAAGIRRASGGAIVLNADASAIADLQRPYSLDALLADVVATSHDLAYIVVRQGDAEIAHGETGARDVLDVASDIDLGAGPPATLQVGLRSDSVRQAQRQTAIRLAVSYSALLLLAGFAVGFLFVRQQYGVLSERHALAQDALRRRDRLAVAGELAGTIAHEIRNPLNAIAMSAQRLRREFLPSVDARAADRDDLVELIGVLESETTRVNTRVQQFLEYGRPPGLAVGPVDLASFAGEVVAAAAAMAEARGVHVDARLETLPPVMADPAQLRHALENILRNAIEAAPAGGRVAVSTGRDGASATIAVTDTGPGIADADLPRIFDLYYSTKPDGSGIGLAVAHQVVAAHGGTIAVETRPGTGTTMTIRLPQTGGGSHA